MAERTDVIISSTARDLPAHRKEVMDACLRLGMFSHMMEQLPANDAEAISASLQLVDEAEIYIGVFAHRYGYVPKENNPQQISVTEMEYNRAVARKIPRLIFMMDKTHPITIDDVEQGANADKLKTFKERVQMENIVNFFISPADLRAQVINTLSQYRQPDLTTFHYVSDIPAPPEPFIAHPYTLLQTHRLVGRQPELNLLTDWVAKPDADIYRARILNIVAVGGLGKSALTWKWFNDIAPQEMKPLAGRMWWSFYESDATFENFVTRALAYVTRRPLAEVQQTLAPERETQLLAALDREPFLIVLDGLERMLIAYARMDAAHLSDDDYDKQTANVVANAYGLPAGAAQSFTGEHRLRKTADPRAALFLRKLANVRASRILVSTRLYPADLQMVTGEPLPNCYAIFLRGLSDDEALDLWRTFGARGARASLLPLFQRADNHPLLIQALASEVARYRPAPGDFDAWRRTHPDFNPFRLPLVQVKSHVLEFALRGLDDKAQQVLRTIAAFRMPARYDTLAALLIGEGKPCADERELDEVLTELEDRGLVGWDKRASRYDLHPLVRGVVWSGLGDDARRGVYTSLHAHLEAVPMIDDYLKVNSLEDLTPAIELYNTLIGLGRYDDAERFFDKRLDEAMLYRLSASQQRVELLELLFPDGLEQLPRLNSQDAQAYTLNALALGYQLDGQPGRAAALFRRANTILSEVKDDGNLSAGLRNLSYTLQLSGALFESESAARRALVITRERADHFQEAISLYWLGSTLAARGLANESKAALQRALGIFTAQSNSQSEGVVSYFLAQRALWLGEFADALSFANRAWELAHVQSLERDFVRAARLQGEAALGLGDLATADERLHHALTRARKVNYVEEELPALVALAELRRRQGDAKAARELLDDVWEAAERGPYPLFHADACNVLAQVERDEGNQEKAVEAATKAYGLAWCDGPPFAYHWGVEKARGLLRELEASEPVLPAFDAAKFEPMPEVEIESLTSEDVIQVPDMDWNELSTAQRLVESVSTMGRRTLGTQYTSRKASLNALVKTLMERGDYSEAETLLREILELEKENIDKEHSSYKDILHNLARILTLQDKQAEADTLLGGTDSQNLLRVRSRPIDEIVAFFEGAGYEILYRDGNDFRVIPKLSTERATYGSSLVRYHKTLPLIEEMQSFCQEALRIHRGHNKDYFPSFIVCPDLEPHLQLQAAVYQEQRLIVVPLNYSWILEVMARGEQRKEMQYVLEVFVGRQDPFHYSNAVNIPGDFYGREKATANLIRDLDRGQSAGLFGMRKIGKTSLIQHTLRTRLGPIIYIDCQSITKGAMILNRLPKELCKSLQKIVSHTVWPEFKERSLDDVEPLAEAVRDYLLTLYELYLTNVAEGKETGMITVVLDEVDRVVTTARRSPDEMREYEALFGLLRGLGQGMERILVCLVAGFSPDITHRDIGLSEGTAGNPVYEFFKPHRLAPMSSAEIDIMMNGLGSRARLCFTELSAQQIHQWSGGHPLLARLIGSLILRNVKEYGLERINTNAGEAFVVTPEIVDRAAQLMLDNVDYRHSVREILERYGDSTYQAIFVALAQAGAKGCTRAELLNSIRTSRSKADIISILESLEFSYMTTNKHGRYRLFARLLIEFIQREYA